MFITCSVLFGTLVYFLQERFCASWLQRRIAVPFEVYQRYPCLTHVFGAILNANVDALPGMHKGDGSGPRSFSPAVNFQ